MEIEGWKGIGKTKRSVRVKWQKLGNYEKVIENARLLNQIVCESFLLPNEKPNEKPISNTSLVLDQPALITNPGDHGAQIFTLGQRKRLPRPCRIVAISFSTTTYTHFGQRLFKTPLYKHLISINLAAARQKNSLWTENLCLASHRPRIQHTAIYHNLIISQSRGKAIEVCRDWDF